jgi:hypothetical protein
MRPLQATLEEKRKKEMHKQAALSEHQVRVFRV